MKHRMKKSTKAKLLAVITIVMCLLSAVAALISSQLNKSTIALMQDEILYTKYVGNFGDASAYLTNEVRAYAATGDITRYNNYWREVNTDKNRDKAVAALRELGLTAEEESLISKISNLSNNLIPLEEQAMALTEAGETVEAVRLLNSGSYADGVAEIVSIRNEFEDEIMQRIDAKRQRLSEMASVAQTLSYIDFTIVIIIQILIISFVLRELIGPICEMHHVMAGLLDGELDSEINLPEDDTEVGDTAHMIREFQTFQKEIIADLDYLLSQMGEGNFDVITTCQQNYRGDYANILEALKKINFTLDKTLKNIREAAIQVDAGAEQMSTGAQALSRGAIDQAASTQELSSTVGDINAQIKQAEEYASNASSKATQAGELTQSCNQEMKELVAAMTEISKSSEEIGKIIKTIEDIAFQTNILALNAAVEAARAGSAGKGFAVVADEVRNLAAKSAEASQNTAQLIESSISSVSKGVQLVQNTAKNLQAVADHSQEVGQMVSRIAETSKEQSASIHQVSIGLDQISAVVQTNSATAEESAATSEQLSRQAATLKELVGAFQLRKDRRK